MKKRVAIYLILIAFVSHNVLYFFKMLSGTQPQINASCPVAISLLNTPLLFDRDDLFFNTQVFNLTYSNAVVSLTRRDIRKGLFSYFDMLYFSHWGKYYKMPGANAAILSHYFCHNQSFLEKMNLAAPQSVERKVFDSKNNVVVEESVVCEN